MGTEPTKADLKAAVAKLIEENVALFDIFAAVKDAARTHADYPWIVGYIGDIGGPRERGDVQLLRVYAASVRRGPDHAEPAPVTAGDGQTYSDDLAAITAPTYLLACGDQLNDGGTHAIGDQVCCAEHDDTAVVLEIPLASSVTA